MKKILLTVAMLGFIAAVNAGEPVAKEKKETKACCKKEASASCHKEAKACADKETKACADKKAGKCCKGGEKAEKTTKEAKPAGTTN